MLAMTGNRMSLRGNPRCKRDIWFCDEVNPYLLRFMEKIYTIYILTNKNNNVLYTGITSNLKKRVYEHKNKIVKGFTEKYNVNKLIYYEIFDSALNAIMREKQIKSGSRSAKIKLIVNKNHEWKDLYEEL